MPIGIGAAILGAGALGLGGSLFGGSSSKKAAAKQAKAQAQINQQQLDFARELRGEGGSPVFLPTYSGDRETELFDIADTLFANAAPSSNRDSEVEALATPFLNDFNTTLRDVRSGERTNQLLENTAPVRSARSASASSRLDAINQALDETLAQLNASESKKGFSGGGSFRNNRALQSTLGARQDAANAVSAANLANAADEANIRNQQAELALQLGLQAPDLARASIGLQNAQNTVPIQEYLDALQVYAPFNTSQTNNAAASLVGGLRSPQFSGVSPAANALGFLGSFGSQYAAQQQQQQMLDQILIQQMAQQFPVNGGLGVQNAGLYDQYSPVA